MIRQQEENTMQKVKKIIIIEYGKNKYSAEKMQGAGIKMYILKRQSDVKDIKEVQNAGVRLCRCYIIGTPGFVDKIQKEIKKRNLGWKCITNYSDEDSVMRAEGMSFPKKVEEGMQIVSESEIKKRIREFHADDLDEEEIAGVLLAADELESLKIFPNTPENQYNALVQLTMEYIQDETSAKNAVDAFLKISAQRR